MYKDVFWFWYRLCIVLRLSFWSYSFPALTLSCIIINFHMVCSLRVAKMLWLGGISSILVRNVCIIYYCFLSLLYHCLLLLLVLLLLLGYLFTMDVFCLQYNLIDWLIDWLLMLIQYNTGVSSTVRRTDGQTDFFFFFFLRGKHH